MTAPTTDRTTTPERPYTGQFFVMDETGDSRIMWHKDEPEEVAAARAQFETLTKDKRYKAFHVTNDKGDQGVQMDTFDPKAERVLFVKQYRGG